MKEEVLKIVLTNLTIFFALVSIHEISHLTFAYLLGCSSGKVVLFDLTTGHPYTELYCSQAKNALISFGGLIGSLAFGFLFLLDKSLRGNFFLILGFSLLLSYLDIASFINIPFFLSLPLILVGEYKVASNLLEKTNLLP